MRLLHTNRLEVVSIRDDAIPPYAILSHTWGDHEVSLQDMQSFGNKLVSPSKRKKLSAEWPGLSKIISAANLARSQAYHWLWIDTCCIDKTSSAELSEAINSMYRFYQDCKICYVYLQDTLAPAYQRDAREAKLSILKSCRWAKRGWTLQELIAPQVVHFYSGDWTYQGQRNSSSFADALSEVTGIEVGVLTGHVTAAQVSVANRMKWVSKRETTRPEDIAYCVMGLFGVNMPLLYGEGASRAFIRLQEQILKVTDDQSIFAWELPRHEEAGDMHGLLAKSPSYFISERSIYTMSIGFQSSTSVPWSMTNKGLQVQLFAAPDPDRDADQYLVVLDCFLDQVPSHSGEELSPAIYLRNLWGDQYTRVQAHVCPSVGERARKNGHYFPFFVKQDPSFVLPDVGISPHLLAKHTYDHWLLQKVYPESLSGLLEGGTFQLSLSQVRGIQAIFRFCKNHQGKVSEFIDAAVVLHRTARAGLEAVSFLRPVDGAASYLSEVYVSLNASWIRASLEDQDKMVVGHQHQIPLAVGMTKAVRSGRGLYLLDIHDIPCGREDTASFRSLSSAKHQNHKVEDLALKKAASIPYSENSLEGDLQPLLDPMHPHPSSPNLSMRSRMQLIIRDTTKAINPAVKTFWQAVLDGNEVEVARLLQGVDNTSVRSCLSSNGGLQAIHFASLARNNQSNVVAMLLQKGADLWATSEEGWTSLLFASVFANSGVIRPMLQHALRAENRNIVSSGSSVDLFYSACESIKANANTAAVLHLAAVYCPMKEFANIISSVFETFGLNHEGWKSPELERQRQYLFDLQNSRGQTVLQTAAVAGNAGVVKLICETAPGATARKDYMSRTSMWSAAYGGNVEILQTIGTAYSKSNTEGRLSADDYGMTPLHVACWRGNADCVMELLKLGASSLEKTNRPGLTPFHYAALFGHRDCLKAMSERAQSDRPLITDASTDVSTVCQEGDLCLFQPIHLAAANGWLDCVAILARNGASLGDKLPYYYAISRPATEARAARPFKGLVQVPPSTPAEMAEREGYEDVAAFLRAASLRTSRIEIIPNFAFLETWLGSKIP